MKITKIAKQERRNRYNVFADGTFLTALAADVLAESGWHEGREIDPAELDRYTRRDEYAKALAKAYSYLARRLHSISELTAKLDRKEYDPKLISEVTAHLEELGYLDDLAFARQWVMERGAARGSKLLRVELRKKGLSDRVIDEVLVEHRENHDPIQEAKVLAAKRFERLGDDPKAEEKTTAYLVRRGYDFDVIRAAIAELTG